MISTTERPRGATAPWSPLKAIVVGGLLAGLCDMSYALIWFSGVKGVPAIKIPQSVAGGLIGKASFDGGIATAILGLGLHWLIAFIWATIFVVAARRFIPALLRNPFPIGLLYGAFVYFCMNWIVLPLDAMHTKPHFAPWDTWLTGLFVHMFGVGLSIALSAAKMESNRA
ncbi:MAG TPA: hypothetical protein VGO46_06340 [Gemmatimonadaceae bacterium]|jgi:uncharacterized membrane protein YagU involved in acid resistance|nr:hypothetical protein [Gemmatimonadaceae bacterium]